ncbi:hypothetical protein ACROYT_G042058 [Oculina patagonica]
MNNKIVETHDSMCDSIEQKIQQIWKQSPNLPDTTVEELKIILARLKSLPFKDEKQRASLFESVKCLQGYHIIQIFNVGVARLQQSTKESSKCIAKIIKLFEICSSFCYTADVSKRISFEYYLRALKLCFPSDPKKLHFSAEIISMLLKLVQILQEEKLCTYPFMDLAKPDLCLKGARDLFNELLTILESRSYDESDIIDIISQALSDTVLAEVYKLFLSNGCTIPSHVTRHKAQTLESIRQLLFALPEGSLVVRVLKFWNHVFPNDSDYTALKRLLDLFTALKTKGSGSTGVCLEERAERLLKFITNVLSPAIMPFVHSWANFLGLLTSIFPISFDKLPVVLSFIEKAVQTALPQTKASEEYQSKTCVFLNWLSQQKCSEKVKENMAVLYLRSVDPMSGYNSLSVDLIKSLCSCKPLSLSFMETFIQEMVGFSKYFEPCQIDIIRDFVSKVASSRQGLVNHEDIFTELCNTMKHLFDENKTPAKYTRVETFEFISLQAKVPLSSLQTVRLFQLSRKSTDGLRCCLRYLQLTSSTSAILKERASEHFELLFTAMFETLDGNKNLCETFYIHHCSFTELFPTSCLSVDHY